MTVSHGNYSYFVSGFFEADNINTHETDYKF